MTERMVCMGCTLKPKNLKTFPKNLGFSSPTFTFGILQSISNQTKSKIHFKNPANIGIFSAKLHTWSVGDLFVKILTTTSRRRGSWLARQLTPSSSATLLNPSTLLRSIIRYIRGSSDASIDSSDTKHKWCYIMPGFHHSVAILPFPFHRSRYTNSVRVT